MKNSVVRYSIAMALCGFFSLSSANAQITYTLTPSLTGGTDVEGSGTGFVDRVDGIASSDWDVQNFTTDFFIDTPVSDPANAPTFAGTFTNVTTGVSENIISFQLDRDAGVGTDDIDFDTENVLSFSFNDEYSFSLTANFDAATLPFSDLIPGKHEDPGHTQGAGISEESFGITTVIVVPEPSSMIIALLCFIGAAGIRRSRRS